MTDGRGVEAVFEHVGHAVWAECMKSMARQGRLVTCGATTGPKVDIDLRHVFIKNLQILGSTMGSKGDLYAMLPFLAQGRLTPIIDDRFAYTAVREAQQRLEASQNFGKVLLTWQS